MVSILGEHKPFIFPETAAPKRRLRHILEQKVTDNYYLTVPQLQMIIGHCERKLSEGCGFATNFQTSQGIAGAICAGYGHYPTDTCLAEPVACAFRGRNIENPSDRSRGAKTAQRIEIGDTVANCITTVEKDSLVAEPKILGYTRDNKGVVVSRHLKEFAGSVCASNFRNTGSTAEFVAEPMVIQRSATPPGMFLKSLRPLLPQHILITILCISAIRFAGSLHARHSASWTWTTDISTLFKPPESQ